MKYKLVTTVFLLLLCLTMSYFVSVAKAASVDSWVNIDVVSFDGDNILFNLEVSVRGDHTAERMSLGIMKVTYSGSFSTATFERWIDISDPVYNEGTNLTVFSYFYSYNHTFYRADPKCCGYLVFPWDKHSLTLYLLPSFNIMVDDKPRICKLPSQNYEGMFQVRFTPTNDRPTMCTVTVNIQHSESFSNAATAILGITLVSLYALSIYLIILTMVVFRKKSKTLSNIVTVSSAIIFFVPAFEIAFYNLKAPLSLVFSDILLIILIPLNVITICFSIFTSYRNKDG